MNWSIFPSFHETIYTLLSGIIFGFLIRKATLSRFNTMIGQLLLKDFTVLKVLLSAIITAAIGLAIQDGFSIKPIINLSSMPMLLTSLGGLLFGVGMAITGYTPGTMVAAIAEGSKDGITGIFGMVVGTLLFNSMYPFFYNFMTTQDAVYKKTLYQHFEFSELLLVIALGIGLFVVGKFSRKKSH